MILASSKLRGPLQMTLAAGDHTEVTEEHATA
jgi:hypothetical protein